MGISANCSICGSGDVKEMLTLKDGKKILRCKRCKNAFTFPKPIIPDYAADDFQAKEGEREKLTLVDELAEETQTSYALQENIISRNIPKGSSVLEIGGGEGIFLEQIKKKGYKTELIEPSVTAARRAQRRGLTVHNDYVQNISLDKKFSVICMAHVLEHIENPIDAINRFKMLLEPNGFILLTQTNFRGFMPSFLKGNWYAWVSEQHFTHFSVAGLHYVAKQTGMTVKEYKYSRLIHGPSIYHEVTKYIPFLQDQIHVLLQAK